MKLKALPKANSYTLANGFKIITAQNKAHPLLALQLYVRVGSCNERDEEAGFSHYLEHLLFKSAKHPENAITQNVADLGGEINAYTSHDLTCFHLTLASQYLREGFQILAEIAQTGDFSKKDFQVEKQIILQEIQETATDFDDYVTDNAPRHYFVESPYIIPILGTKKSIRGAKYDDLIAFYEKYYTPDNSFFVAVGDFDKQKLLEVAEEFFGGWKRNVVAGNPVVKKPKATIFPNNTVTYCESRNLSIPKMAFTIPSVSANNEHFLPLNIIFNVFANGHASLLHRRLVLEEKLVSHFYNVTFRGLNDGLSLIVTHPKDDKHIEKIVSLFLKEFDNLKHITNNEIEFAKTSYLHSFRHIFEFIDNIGFYLGHFEALGNYETLYSLPEQIKGVNKEIVRQLIKEYYIPERLGFSLYKPAKKYRNLMPKLDKIISEWKDERKSLKTPYYKTRESHKDEFRSLTLQNGTKLRLKNLTGKPTIGITAAFKTSYMNEPMNLKGINKITYTLFQFDNKKRNHEQLVEYHTNIGTSLSLSTTPEITTITLNCFPEKLYECIQSLADMTFTPLFSKEQLLNTQQTFITDYNTLKDNPSQHAFYLWEKQLLGNDSIMLNENGTKTTMRNMTRKKVVNWHRQHYQPSKMSLSIVGDFSFEEMALYCDKILSNYPVDNEFDSTIQPYDKLIANELERLKSLKRNNGKHYKTKNANDEYAIVHVGGFCSPNKDVKKNTTLYLIREILAGNVHTRLYNELREKRGLIYAIYFNIVGSSHLSYYVVDATVNKKNIEQVISIILDNFEKLAQEKVTDKELASAKTAILGSILRSEESVEIQSMKLAHQDLYEHNYDFYLKSNERIMQITADDIQQLAEEYLKREDQYIHIYT